MNKLLLIGIPTTSVVGQYNKEIYGYLKQIKNNQEYKDFLNLNHQEKGLQIANSNIQSTLLNHKDQSKFKFIEFNEFTDNNKFKSLQDIEINKQQLDSSLIENQKNQDILIITDCIKMSKLSDLKTNTVIVTDSSEHSVNTLQNMLNKAEINIIKNQIQLYGNVDTHLKVENARIEKENKIKSSGFGRLMRNFWKCPFHSGAAPENKLSQENL